MRRFIAVTIALLGATAPLSAQGSLLDQCGALPVPAALNDPAIPQSARDAVMEQFGFLCAQVANSVENVQPSIGIAFSGANPTIGTATTIGRRLGLFPRISVSARLNAAFVDVPDIFDDFSPTLDGSSIDATVPALGTVGLPVASLQADVALGLFNGIDVGPIGGFGSLDLLGSVSFIPAVDEINIEETIFNFGGGARLGLIRQGLLMPGVSVTGQYRMMGEQTFGDVDGTVPAEFSSDLQVISLRAMASKGLLMLDVAAGGGYDIYKSDVSMAWQLTCATTECQDVDPTDPAGITLPGSVSGTVETAAWNVFANAGISLLIVNIVAEVGYQKATEIIGSDDLSTIGLPSDQELTTEALEGGRFFGSVGARITF